MVNGKEYKLLIKLLRYMFYFHRFDKNVVLIKSFISKFVLNTILLGATLYFPDNLRICQLVFAPGKVFNCSVTKHIFLCPFISYKENKMS
jgi:hypothetical protein